MARSFPQEGVHRRSLCAVFWRFVGSCGYATFGRASEQATRDAVVDTLAIVDMAPRSKVREGKVDS